MSIRTSPWPAGVPCWADLTVPDLDAARAYYGQVLGWTFRDLGPDYGGFVIAEARGAAAAAIGPHQQEGPRSWTLYFASDDVDKTAAAVSDHGGKVVVPAGGVGPMGRLFLADDPTGARFGVWQAGTHIGAGIANEPGGLTWEDLRSPDPAAACAFYEAVFGHRTEALPEAGGDYWTFSRPDEEAPLGGIGGMMGAGGQPAHWLVYFGVADAAATVEAAGPAGGSVLVGDFDTPYGRMAELADPAGAVFRVIETEDQPQPDRAG